MSVMSPCPGAIWLWSSGPPKEQYWSFVPKKIIESIAASKQQLAALRLVGEASDARDPAALEPTIEELSSALEEIDLAVNDLHLQYEQLVEGQTSAEDDRRRYQEVFEHAPVAYVLTDAGGLILEANRRTGALLRSQSRRLVGKPFAIMVEPEDRRKVRRR